jgi:hypothetical protein
METIAVFANDAAYARHILAPMLNSAVATHWVVVACPPTLTRHIGRWLSQSARAQWRQRWAAELFDALEPELKAHAGSRVEKMLAKRPLTDLSERLETRLGAVRLLDARRPRLGEPNEPISRSQPDDASQRLATSLALASGLGAVLALAD